MSVQRLDYDEYETNWLSCSDDGPFVNYSDYAALEARCAELKQERDAAVAENNTLAAQKSTYYYRAGVAAKERDALQTKMAAAEEALDIIEQEAGDANKSRNDPWVILARIENLARAALDDTTTDEVQP